MKGAAASCRPRPWLSLTEIALAAGFTDSAHFSNAWLKSFGGSPTHFFCNERVEVMTVFRAPSCAGERVLPYLLSERRLSA